MSNGKRNRQAGHKLETDRCKDWHAIGIPNVVTARSESKSRDDSKIDLMFVDEHINGVMPYAEQDKCSTKTLPYPKLLAETKIKAKELGQQVVPLLVHRMTKADPSGRFMVTGEYAILYLEDFMELAAVKLAYDKLCKEHQALKTKQESKMNP